MKFLRALGTALAYFSILPAGRFAAGGPPEADALAYLPFVGAGIGALAGLAAWGMSLIAPHALVVATAFGATIVLSGALHVDGFLDSCDALFAPVPATRRLEIFKDPRHGTFAVAGLVVASAFWLGALDALPPAMLPALLAFSGALARFGAILCALRIPYVRAGALAKTFERRLPLGVLGADAVLVLALAFLVAPWAPALAAAIAPLPLFAGLRIATLLDGGLVGDVYGFLIVTTEVATLVLFAALLR